MSLVWAQAVTSLVTPIPELKNIFGFVAYAS